MKKGLFLFCEKINTKYKFSRKTYRSIIQILKNIYRYVQFTFKLFISPFSQLIDIRFSPQLLFVHCFLDYSDYTFI